MSLRSTVQNGAPAVLESSLLHGLDTEERDRLAPLLESVMLRHGDPLANVGEPSAYLWFPNGAIVSAVVRLDGGAAVEAGLIGPEGVVGLEMFSGNPASLLTAIVQVPGAAYRCNVEAIRERLDEFPGLKAAALRYGGTLLAAIAQVAACNATHTLRQRMSRWLLMAHDRAGRDRFRLTHEFVATMINVRRAGVSQFASEMRAAGAIAYTRGEVRIADRTVLEGEACECYGAIRRFTFD